MRNQFPVRGATTAAVEFFAITPDDDADLPQVPRAIFVGVAGNLAIQGQLDEAPVIFKGLSAGQTIVIAPARVLATGTTATDLVALV